MLTNVPNLKQCLQSVTCEPFSSWSGSCVRLWSNNGSRARPFHYETSWKTHYPLAWATAQIRW